MTDMVNHPPHYKQGDVECIDAIRSALTEEEFRGYCKGNALKYIWREKYKGGNESLAKAIWHLTKVTCELADQRRGFSKKEATQAAGNILRPAPNEYHKG